MWNIIITAQFLVFSPKSACLLSRLADSYATLLTVEPLLLDAKSRDI